MQVMHKPNSQISWREINMAMKNINTKVITGKVRLSYANVWEPASINGGEEKYSVSLIIPKSDTTTIGAIQAAVDAAIEAGIGKFGGKKPNKASIKLNVPRTRTTRMPISSMQTPGRLRRLSTARCSRFWIAMRCIPAAMRV